MNEIDIYPEGKALDIMVAEEVIGLEIMRRSNHLPTYRLQYPDNDWAEIPIKSYSTDDTAALEVVRHLCQDGREPNELYFRLVYGWWYKADREAKGYPLVWAVFDWKESGDSKPLYQGLADTIPLAICRAALRVVRKDLSLPE